MSTDWLPRFCAKVALLASIQHFATTILLEDVLPQKSIVNSWSFALSLGVLVFVIDGIIIYPFFRSPLRHLPTEKTSVFQILREQPRGSTPLKWFKKYPNVDMIVGRGLFNSRSLFLVTPDALRDVLGNNSYDFEKTSRARAFLGRIIGDGLILSEGDVHKKQRRALTPAFHMQNIRSLYALMWEKTQIFLDQLQIAVKEQGHIEMASWASRFTLDIIGPAALSRDFQSMTSGEHGIADAFLEIVEPSRAMLAYMAAHFLLPGFISKNLPVKPNRTIQRNSAYLRRVCGEILAEKRASLKAAGGAKDSNDIMATIINGGEFRDDEVVDQMLTFLAAGHETTASALTWCTYLLCQNPDIQERLRQEIRSCIISASSHITHDTLESMPYLNGVCEEVLRLFPTVPVTTRGTIRDTTIAGQFVPAGTFVVMPIYAINRNPRFWGPDADKMKPERWTSVAVDGSRRIDKSGGTPSNFCSATFLHGQRSCIGKDFAKAELRCAVAGVFGKYSVKMLDPNEDVQVAGTVTTKPKNGLRVVLETVDGW